jgi:hypothetical protein
MIYKSESDLKSPEEEAKMLTNKIPPIKAVTYWPNSSTYQSENLNE